jgi:hypothetical protein
MSLRLNRSRQDPRQQPGAEIKPAGLPILALLRYKAESPLAPWVGVVMGPRFYTTNFKDRIGLGSGPILIHF